MTNARDDCDRVATGRYIQAVNLAQVPAHLLVGALDGKRYLGRYTGQFSLGGPDDQLAIAGTGDAAHFAYERPDIDQSMCGLCLQVFAQVLEQRAIPNRIDTVLLTEPVQYESRRARP